MNENVLVLNQNFEPLNVCDTKRAMCLIVVGKADVLENGRGVIRTPSRTFLRPSVIRLNYMIHRPRPEPRLTRREVFRRDNFTCQYCGKRAPQLTIDHVVPRHRGGHHTWENLVTACPRCNVRKGGRTLQEAGMTLLKWPRKPPATYEYMFRGYLEQHAEWAKFIEGWH
ncbi:MAG: HNH endonuclease [Chloroflexi bacterium]|nr:MAG: HNH endonuclease [Chloroflexota bacterium]